MMGQKAQLDICEICGVTIAEEELDLPSQILPFLHERIKVRNCYKCMWEEYQRDRTTTKRPYQVPAPRADKAGNPPQAFIEHLQSLRHKET